MIDELVATVDGLEEADHEQLLGALQTLHGIRALLDQWEPALITAARARGVTWAQIAPALGLASRQAAERRYLRLAPQAAGQSGTTREHRVQATRDQRSGDRAVADWARDNAAALRQLAGQISALDSSLESGLDAATRSSVERVRAALGHADAAELVDPLTAAGPPLSTSHPGLADQITALGEAADQIRDADLTRRTTPRGTDA